MFIHENIYPDEENHLWIVGDLPEHVIKTIFKKIYLRELFCEANPFQYIRALDTLQYYDNLNMLSEEFIHPDSMEFFDGDKVERFMCWTDELAQKYPYTTKPKDMSAREDRLDLVIEAEIWKLSKQTVHIGVKNRHPQKKPQTFDIKIRAITHQETLTPEQLQKFELYNSLYEEIDAHNISNVARTELDMHWKTELIYGEVRYLYFIPCFEFVKPKEGEVFYDLGCGASRPQMLASLNFPFLKACKGIEFLKMLADCA